MLPQGKLPWQKIEEALKPVLKRANSSEKAVFRDRFDTINILRPPRRPEDLIDLISSTISKNTKHTRSYSVYQFRDLCRAHKRNILL